MDRRNRIGLAIVLFGLCRCAVEHAPEYGPRTVASRTTAVLGTNLSGVTDWSSELVFSDLFKMSRPFFSGTTAQWQDQKTLELDGRGFVRTLGSGQIARTLMLSDAVSAPAGVYSVYHEGRGTLEYRYAGRTDRMEANGARIDRLTLPATKEGIAISIIATDAKDPLRNFRVSLPGLETSTKNESARFNPQFLERLAPYGVLRFMDWMQTNGSQQTAWEDRPKLDDASWSRKGVPVEVMVELANESDTDPWFCMPHLATDAYVEQFATYVRDHVATARTIYVEYSNEVWNSAFEQSNYARTQGQKLGLSGDPFEAQMRFYAQRSTEVHKIWERVFGGSARLIRVTSSQAENSWVSTTVLGFRDTAAHTDALAIAPFFGGRMGDPMAQERVQAMDVDELLDQLRTVEVPQAVRAAADHQRIAGSFGLELVAYEGGQHLAGTGSAAENDAINKLFDAANTDPEMKAIYADYLAGWKMSGGRLFNHFTSCAMPSSSGRWGALEWLGQPREEAPKYDALVTYVANNPRWW